MCINGGYYTGDPYLRLYDQSGTQIAVNDDYCGLGSQMTATITSCGTYTVREGCYTSGSCTGLYFLVLLLPLPADLIMLLRHL